MKNKLKILAGITAIMIMAVFLYGENAVRDANRVPATLFYDGTSTRMPRVNELGETYVSGVVGKIQERFNVTPYTEVEKTYENVARIEVFKGATAIRIALQDNTTDDTDIDYQKYTVLPATLFEWIDGGNTILEYAIKFKGDTESDTDVVQLIVHQYK